MSHTHRVAITGVGIVSCLGIGTEDLLLSPGDVHGMAVDPTSQALFWTDTDGGSILRLDEGAPAAQTIISGQAWECSSPTSR